MCDAFSSVRLSKTPAKFPRPRHRPPAARQGQTSRHLQGRRERVRGALHRERPAPGSGLGPGESQSGETFCWFRLSRDSNLGPPESAKTTFVPLRSERFIIRLNSLTQGLRSLVRCALKNLVPSCSVSVIRTNPISNLTTFNYFFDNPLYEDLVPPERLLWLGTFSWPCVYWTCAILQG